MRDYEELFWNMGRPISPPLSDAPLDECVFVKGWVMRPDFNEEASNDADAEQPAAA